MYFSKLVLDIMHPSVRQALVNCQDMHRNIMKAFGNTREKVQMLYRLVEKKQSIELFVYCTDEPAWDNLKANGYTLVQMKEISTLPQLYGNESVLRFDLQACPSKKVSEADRKNSRRVSLFDHDERMAWLQRQAEKYGFEILEAHMPSADKKINGKKGNIPFSLIAVEYAGVLRIKNAEVFWNAYR